MTSILVDKFMEKYVHFELFSLKLCTVLEECKRTPQCEVVYIQVWNKISFVWSYTQFRRGAILTLKRVLFFWSFWWVIMTFCTWLYQGNPMLSTRWKVRSFWGWEEGIKAGQRSNSASQSIASLFEGKFTILQRIGFSKTCEKLK